jgi:hypothetical protein
MGKKVFRLITGLGFILVTGLGVGVGGVGLTFIFFVILKFIMLLKVCKFGGFNEKIIINLNDIILFNLNDIILLLVLPIFFMHNT